MPWLFVSKWFFEKSVALGLTIWRGVFCANIVLYSAEIPPFGAFLPCHPERRKSHGVRFSQSNPTIGRARSEIYNQFSLCSAEIPNDTSHRSILATLGFRLRSGWHGGAGKWLNLFLFGRSKPLPYRLVCISCVGFIDYRKIMVEHILKTHKSFPLEVFAELFSKSDQ